MGSFVLLDVGRPTEIEATADRQGVWVNPEDIEATLGWELKPEGLCKDAVCIPVTGHRGFARDGAIQLQALADVLGRPLALSLEEGIAYLGPPPDLYQRTVGELVAPEFALPDLESRLHSLSEYRGSKVLLAAWASW